MADVSQPLIRPMLATAGALPSAPAPGRPGWATEMKWDGVRAVAYVAHGELRLVSRNDREISVSYPELFGLPAAIGVHEAVMDGEIVAMDARGRPDFGLLQSRMHVVDIAKARKLAEGTPVCYLLFDLLQVDGRSALSLPYGERRDLLEQLDVDGDHLLVPPAFDGDPADALAASLEQGLEGVVCKRLDSMYLPGRRSPAWVKVKHLRMQEVVVIGWEPGQGRRDGAVGALLLGVHVDGVLRYAGQVGTGFSERTLADLRARLLPLQAATSPAAGVPSDQARQAVWVRPELVGEVVYSEWTRDHRLRHPSWRGLRPDKNPVDVSAPVATRGQR
jgi:bifunctional non-homologous end joining protein LigD